MGNEISFTMVRYMNSIYRMVPTICCLYAIYYNLLILLHHVEAGCGCDGQSGSSETGFSLSSLLWFFPATIIPPLLHTHSFINN